MDREIKLERYARFNDYGECYADCDFILCDEDTNNIPCCALSPNELCKLDESEDENGELFTMRSQFCIDSLGN